MADFISVTREIAGIGTKLDSLAKELETWKKAQDRCVETLGIVMEQKDAAQARARDLEAELDERRRITIADPVNRYKQGDREIEICPTCWVTHDKPVAVTRMEEGFFECPVCLNRFGGSDRSNVSVHSF